MESRLDFGTPASDQVYKIIYHSQIAFEGGHEAVANHIREILAWSREWNPNYGITGALMVNARNFAQVLEGPAAAVKSLFGHIVCDRRHTNVELLQAGWFESRDFGNWTMAFAGSARAQDIDLAASSFVDDHRLGTGANSVRNLLRWLLLEEQPVAQERRAFG